MAIVPERNTRVKLVSVSILPIRGRELRDRARDLTDEFETFEIVWVDREENIRLMSWWTESSTTE
jgi:hypothetical protein